MWLVLIYKCHKIWLIHENNKVLSTFFIMCTNSEGHKLSVSWAALKLSFYGLWACVRSKPGDWASDQSSFKLTKELNCKDGLLMHFHCAKQI
jgi:hypothetical protein